MPEEEIELSNSKIQDMAKSIVPPHLPQIINKNKNSQPAKKNYAALILGINKTPNDLLGLVPEQLIEMLGPPGFRRADAPADWEKQTSSGRPLYNSLDSKRSHSGTELLVPAFN
jgi:hypothetical protein